MNGVYALIIRLNVETIVSVGALGKIAFDKGIYVYVGSAQANLKQRVKRHLRKEKHLFWHIDFLLESEAAQIEKVLYIQGDKATECEIAKEISTRGDPVNRFGCSDCKCQSHLFHVVDANFLEKQMRALELAT